MTRKNMTKISKDKQQIWKNIYLYKYYLYYMKNC